MTALPFLDALKAAATTADKSESDYRRQYHDRVKALEQERAFAYRRLNFVSAVANAVAPAKDVDQAIGSARATLRSSVGWDEDSETRLETLDRFAPVSRAIFASFAPPEAEVEETDTDVAGALAAFEGWYLAARGNPFWALFEQYVPELPLVER